MAGLGSSLLGDIGRSSASVTHKRKKKPPVKRAPVRKVPAAFGPIAGQRDPLGSAQKTAAAKTHKADRAIPQKPSPKVPYILNPTVAQQRAAGKAVLKAVDEHVLNRRTLQPVNPNDPDARRLAAAADHYGRATARDRLAQIGAQAAAQVAPPRGKFGADVLAGLGAKRQKETVGLGEKVLGDLGRGKSPLTRSQAITLGAQVVAANAIQAKERKGEKKYIGIPGIPLARINLAPLQGATIDFINSHTSLDQAGASRFVKNAIGDVVALGEAPFVGGYAIADAAGQAALHGNWKPLEAQGKGTLDALAHDAFVQLGGAALGIKGASVKGAKEAFVSHPGFTGLDVLGGVGLAGRGLGALGRGLGATVESEGIRGSLARLGDTRRSPLALDDDAGLARAGYVHERDYSKDVVRKAVQKSIDRHTRRPVKDAEGNVVMHNYKGKDVPVLHSRGKLNPDAKHQTLQKIKPNERRRLQHKRADFEAAETQAIETLARHTTEADLHRIEQAGPASKRVKGRVAVRRAKRNVARDIVPLITSGTVRTGKHLEKDLNKRAARIEAKLAEHDAKPAGEGIYKKRSERDQAEENAKLLRAAAKDPKVLGQAEEMAKVGYQYGRELNKAEREKLDTDIGFDEQYHRGRLTEYASAHMDARNFTVEEHRKLESEARKVEHSAVGALRDAREAGAPAPRIAELQAAAKEARLRRIAVSGRDPRGVHGHEEAKAAVRKSDAARTKAVDKHDAAVKAREQLIGAQKHERMQRGVGSKATEAEQARLARATAKRDQAQAELEAAEKAHGHAAQTLASRPLPATQEAIRHPDGRYLPNKEIEAHARLHGRDPDTIAYLPHTEGGIGGRAFHKQMDPSTRPTENSKRRTLHMYERGANTFSRELIREELTHKRTTIAKAQAIDRLLSAGGRLHPIMGDIARGGPEMQAVARKLQTGGRMTDSEKAIARAWSKEQRAIIANKGRFTDEGALDAVEQLRQEGHHYVAVREHAAVPSHLGERIRDSHDIAAMETASLDLLNSRLVKAGDEGKAHNVVLMPGYEIQRLQDHLTPADDLTKMVQMLNAPFRMAVLPQFRWLTGNFVEPYLLRLPLKGAGIFLPGARADARYATKYMKHLEELGTPAAMRELASVRAMLGGLFIGRRDASVRRTFEDMKPGTWEHKAAVVAHVIRNAPFAKPMMDLALSIPKGFFELNRVIESGAQRQALGKSIRNDVQAFTGSYAKTLKATGEIFNEIGAGKLSPSTLQRWTKEQHDLLGKYTGFSPRSRRAIQSYVPFLPWSLAAARFVYMTMPLHHTAATALLIKSSQAVSDQWADAHADVPPGGLKLAQITKKGGLVDIARYTPYGFSGPISYGQFEDIADTFMPQVSSVYRAVQGDNPFGRELKVAPTADNPEGKASAGDIMKIIANSMLEGFTPLVGVARRIAEGGSTGYDNSSLVFGLKRKPDSKHMSGARRALDPFRPTYLKDPIVPASAAAGGSFWDDDDEQDETTPAAGESFWDD